MTSQTINPLIAVDKLKASYIRYLKTAFPIQDHDIRDEFWKALESQGTLVKGPLLEATPEFLKGPSIEGMVSQGILNKKFQDLCNRALPYKRSLYIHQAQAIEKSVLHKRNLVVSTGTGSGKTTLLNVLSSFISDDERIVTLEDAAELQLQQDHVVRLETKPPNADGKRGVSIRNLVRNSLRMRPDRIIVGEVRGGEALDMLQAMNTGHDGSLATVHSNSPRDALARLATLVLMAGMDLPIDVVNKQIASAVDLVVQQTRLKDGSRKVVAVSEVAGMEGKTIVLSDIFTFKQTGIGENNKILGQTEPTGLRPMFASRLEAAGFKLGADVFGANIAEMLASNRNTKRRRR